MAILPNVHFTELDHAPCAHHHGAVFLQGPLKGCQLVAIGVSLHHPLGFTHHKITLGVAIEFE